MGVKISAFLLDVARNHLARSNVEYVQAGVFHLSASVTEGAFTKVVRYEAAPRFTDDEMRSQFETLRGSGARNGIVLLSSAPNLERIWSSYYTPARRKEYHRGTRDGTEAISHGWSSRHLARLDEPCANAATFGAHPRPCA